MAKKGGLGIALRGRRHEPRPFRPTALSLNLVKIANAPRLAVLPHVDAVRVPGAHALNYSDPQLIAELIEAHIAGEPLVTQSGPRSVAAAISVDDK